MVSTRHSAVSRLLIKGFCAHVGGTIVCVLVIVVVGVVMYKRKSSTLWTSTVDYDRESIDSEMTFELTRVSQQNPTAEVRLL